MDFIFFRQKVNQFTGGVTATACLITQIFCVLAIAIFKVKYYAQEKKIQHRNSLGRIHNVSSINETLPHKSDSVIPYNITSVNSATDNNNESQNSMVLNTINGLLPDNHKIIRSKDDNDEESEDVVLFTPRNRALPDIATSVSSTDGNNAEFHGGGIRKPGIQFDITVLNGNDDRSKEFVSHNSKHRILTGAAVRLRSATYDDDESNNAITSNPGNQCIRLNTYAYNKVLIEVYQITFITFSIAVSLAALRVKQRLLEEGIGILEDYPKPLLCFLDIAPQFLVSIILPLTIHIHSREVLEYIKGHFNKWPVLSRIHFQRPRC